MGYISHRALIVTSNDLDDLGEAHREACEIYMRHLTPEDGYCRNIPVGHIHPGTTNGYVTFLIVPDGSNRGRDTSQRCEEAREEFIAWLREVSQGVVGRGRRLHLDWAEIQFGGDDPEHAKLLSHSGDEDWRQHDR